MAPRVTGYSSYNSGATAPSANVVEFPDMRPKDRRELMAAELGTSFDVGQRLFAYYGEGDVFDYGEWGARDMKTMFSRDGVCSAIELVLTLPIREADYSIQAASGDKGEADFVRSVLMTPDQDGGMRTPIQELVGQITSAQIYRRAFFEKTFKIRPSDGAVIYDGINFRPTATCQARYNDRTGRQNGFRQQVWLFGGNLMASKNQKVPGYVDIPKIRSYIYTHNKHREPLVGASEMEVSYWCYQTKMKLLYLWYHFLENQSLPRTIAYGNDPTEATQRAEDIASLKSSGVVGLVHPEAGQKAFEVIETAKDAGSFFLDAMGFLEGWQTHSVLAGFMALTGSATGGKGSYALSQDQSSFYLKSRQGVAKEIASSISADVIRPLVVLNYGTEAAFPRWNFGPLQDEQVQALLTLFGQMAAAPVLHVPLPVFDLLTERMASILQLDVDQVHEALTSTANQRAEQLAGNPPPGMNPATAGSIGQLQGLAQAGTAIMGAGVQNLQQQAGPPRNGSPSGGLPRAMPAPPTAGGPPAKPPMTPPPGRMA
jgi:hypothetical protein